MYSCIYCRKPVTSRQQAIDCDVCGLWQHRACGNTCLTSYKYGLLRRGKISFQFVCDTCNSKPEEDDHTVAMDLSAIPNTCSGLDGTAQGQMESTRYSISINIEDTSARHGRADTSSFDVQRPQVEQNNSFLYIL